MENLIDPAFHPFAIAGLVLVGLVTIEILGLVLGISLGEALDKGIDFDGVDGKGLGPLAVMGWLNAGGVPLMIVLMLLLAGFSASGFVLQTVAGAVAAPLPAWFASAIAFAAALPFTRHGSRLAARVVPKDESYAIRSGDLVGRVGTVTLGPLDHGSPGRLRIVDAHGNIHSPMARAAPGADPIPQGRDVLVVDRIGSIFIAIEAPSDLTGA